MNEDLAKIKDEIKSKANRLDELTEKIKYEFSDGYEAVNRFSEIRAKLKDDYEKRAAEICSIINGLQKEKEVSETSIKELKQNKPSVAFRQVVEVKRFLFLPLRETKTVEDHSDLDKWEEELLRLQADANNISRRLIKEENEVEHMKARFELEDKNYAEFQKQYEMILKQAAEKIFMTVEKFN